MDSGLLRTGAALVRDTFREAAARMVFWGFYGLSTAIIVFFLFILKIDVVEGAKATISLFGQASPRALDLEVFVRNVHGSVASFLYTAGMFLAVFAAAGLMASVFEPGRIELLLSKPVSRWALLAGRYIGTLLVVALNVCYLIAGVWLVFGWRTGVWNTEFLYAIPTTVFIFAVLSSAVALVAALTDSATLGTMIAFGLMVMSPILAQRRMMEKLLSSEWSRDLWNGFYYALPKVYDVGRITMNLVRGRQVDDWTPVWTSAAFMAAMLAAALVCFSRRDF